MKASELRIGNLVNFAEDGTIFYVIGIYPEGLDVENGVESTYIELDAFESIPLTEEWLVKFGVNERESQDVFRINYVDYHKGSETFNYCLGYCFDEEGFIDYLFKEIKHVHQLQNLYFALTGEELTYTL